MSTAGNRGFNYPASGGNTGGQSIGQGQRGNTGKQGDSSSVGGLVNEVKETASDFASTAANRVGDAWDTTRERATQVASSVADTAEEAWSSVTNFIGRYPVACVLAAFGVGFLVNEALHANL